VLLIPTFKLVHKLLLAKQALKLEALLKKLDRYSQRPQLAIGHWNVDTPQRLRLIAQSTV
jgi:hypothetical protein